MIKEITLLITILSLISGVVTGGEKSSATTSPTPKVSTEIVHPIDGAVMVWVPAGAFIMGMDKEEANRALKPIGSDYEKAWAWEWAPKRTVTLPGFFIDKYEATEERWQRYTTATKQPPRKNPKHLQYSCPPEQAGTLPMVQIKWKEAKAYSAWTKKALPTEAQWEKAARGIDGRWYPWGNEMPTDKHLYFDLQKKLVFPVGSFPKGISPYGCLDMSGNVYEWTSEKNLIYPNNPDAARMKKYAGKFVALRGGSFYHTRSAFLCAKRFGLETDETYYHIGFRTVWVPPTGYFKSEAYRTAQKAVKSKLLNRGSINPTKKMRDAKQKDVDKKPKAD